MRCDFMAQTKVFGLEKKSVLSDELYFLYLVSVMPVSNATRIVS